MISNSELESLKAVFSEYSEIEGVYLFGSAASDKKIKYEDIDLGIVYSDPAIEEKKVDLYVALVKQGLDNVDIVILIVRIWFSSLKLYIITNSFTAERDLITENCSL